MAFKILALLFPVLLFSIPGYYEPWGKDADLIPRLSKTFDLDTDLEQAMFLNMADGRTSEDETAKTQKMSGEHFECEAGAFQMKSFRKFRYTFAPLPQQQEIHLSLMAQGMEKLIWFHQNVISTVDGPRSHYKPSSSNYMLLAIRKHGFIKGYIMGCDRLLRENGDPWLYRTAIIDNKIWKIDSPP